MVIAESTSIAAIRMGDWPSRRHGIVPTVRGANRDEGEREIQRLKSRNCLLISEDRPIRPGRMLLSSTVKYVSTYLAISFWA